MVMPPRKKAKKKSRQKALGLKKKKSYAGLKAAERKEVERLSQEYMGFLDRARTERLAVRELVALAEKAGFQPLPTSVGLLNGEGNAPATAGGKGRKRGKGSPLAGRGYYYDFRGKALVLAVTGIEPLAAGTRMVASHLDSPRLDLKQSPVYQDKDSGTVMLRTHYYGGIKKYQWTNIPLSLHGIVVDRQGRRIEVNVGAGPGDPVLVVPDLLPHLSRVKQNRRRLEFGIRGEELQLLAGHEPLGGKAGEDAEEPLKLAVLKYLNDEYGLVEEDLTSAELSAVPAMGVRDVGLDRALIGGYGHDDKGCAFASYKALETVLKGKGAPERTALAVMYDKEEIGSDSPGAAQSVLLEGFIDALLAVTEPGAPSSAMRKCLEASVCLSADVKAGINPCFKGVQDPRNAAVLGGGVTITKYTGRGGKYSASDASAETVGAIRLLFNKGKVVWQATETGKVDEGGGGTVARFLAEKNMEVLDVGLPVLSMHSPFEVIAKSDLWMMEKACREFYNW
jgi:aspartyl aminopeptidase